MPRYLTSHSMACMTRQSMRQLVASLSEDGESQTSAEALAGSRPAPCAGAGPRFLRFLANMTEGKLFGEFEAPDREALLAWMERKKIHHDWLARVDMEATPEGVRDL